MSNIAYALTAEHHDTYLGGVLAIGDDSLDVRKALEDGNGFIVVDDTATIMVLDAYPPLERVPVPDAQASAPIGYVDLDAPDPDPAPVSVADLRAHAKELGIESPGRSREEIQAAITAHVATSDSNAPAPAGAETVTGADNAPAPDTTTEG